MNNERENALVSSLRNPTCPTFLFGCTPPAIQTSNEDAASIAKKFADRGRVLAVDGYIVYDVQDESSRTDAKRPFPFRELQEPSAWARELAESSRKPCIIYKAATCMSSSDHFAAWVDKCRQQDGHEAINVVGAPSSKNSYTGPSTKEASLIAKAKGVKFGAVCIAERHKAKGTEHEILFRKSEWGAEWFITQGIYDPVPMSQLIMDYAELCRKKKVIPKKIILTFTPCGRRKTLSFIKWLGMTVPEEAEQRIFGAADEAAAAAKAAAEGTSPATDLPVKKKKRVVPPVELSCALLCDHLRHILRATAGSGVPLGINVESVSGFRDEIDATHDLFRSLQAILLDASGSAWDIRWGRISASQPVSTWTNGADNQQRETPNILSSSNNHISISRMELALVALGALISGAAIFGARGRIKS